MNSEETGRFWAELWMLLVLLVIATGLLAHSGADLSLAARFYQGNGWPIGEQFPWKLLYRIDRIPAVVLATAWLITLLWSLRNPVLIPWRRAAIFMILLLALGPGLLVNAVFKDHWGRPRPHEVVMFGGTKPFLEPWQPGVNGHGRSFPSGHSSAAFYLATPWFVYRRRKPMLAWAWLLAGTGFGLLMSIARISQGGHFLTDCLWAFGMVWLVGQVLAALLLRDEPHNEEHV